MKVTLGTLSESAPAMVELGSLDLEVRLSFRIAKFIDALNGHLKAFNETQKKMADKYGKGPRKIMSPEEGEKFIEELDELKAEEVEVPDFKVTLADIEGPGGMDANGREIPKNKIKPIHLSALLWMLEE